MTGNLTIWTALALLGAMVVSAGALTSQGRPMQLSRAQFHDNCAAVNGHFAALSGEVVCSLAADRQIVCQFGDTLGNCLWSGPVDAEILARIFRAPSPGEAAT